MVKRKLRERLEPDHEPTLDDVFLDTTGRRLIALSTAATNSGGFAVVFMAGALMVALSVRLIQRYD